MNKKNKAFTLAEIMVVLTVIGVVTAILMPIAFKSAPDKNIMTFKKANSTMVTAIREMLNAVIIDTEKKEKVDKYYGANLGEKAERLGGGDVKDFSFFCETFADMLVTKERKCCDEYINITGTNIIAEDWERDVNKNIENVDSGAENIYDLMDRECKRAQKNEALIKSKIVTIDDVVYYETTTRPFGDKGAPGTKPYVYKWRWNKNKDNRVYYEHNSKEGYFYIYRPFCMDIDGLNKGEDPFGYGVRIDGKVAPGKRASEWINKTIQGDN